jgi:glycosyltransferase involved in cell wall biosynthesis
MKTPRVLLSAYQCAPGQGSVSQIGYEWYSHLAKIVPLTLVTHIRNKPHLADVAVPGSEILYIDTERFAGPLYRFSSRMFPRSQHAVFLLSSLDYFAFDRQSGNMLASMQKEGRSWDLVHCATPVSPLATPTLHRLGMPLVLGPWNGGLKSPRTFPELMKHDSAWLYPLRGLGALFMKLNGRAAHASILLTANATTDASLPREYQSRCVRMLENAVNLDAFQPRPFPEAPSRSAPLKIVYVGRLLPFKGVSMLIDAVRRIASAHPVELSVIGEGPEFVYLRQQVDRLGLTSHVSFHGNKSLEEVAAAMAAAHVLCLPSVRESGGSVLLEAMASGRPVIAVAYGGPAELVDDQVGYAIEPLGPDHVVNELEKALLDIILRHEVWQRKGTQGRARAVQQFGWTAKVRHAVTLYQSVLPGGTRRGEHGSGQHRK